MKPSTTSALGGITDYGQAISTYTDLGLRSYYLLFKTFIVKASIIAYI